MRDTKKVLLAIDIGTTSAKCMAMNPEGKIVSEATRGYSTSRPHSHWVEQNPEDWWEAVCDIVKESLQGLEKHRVEGISLSGHMSALVLVDNQGKVLRPSILITDNRSTYQTDYLNSLYKEEFVKMTGNKPMNAFTVSKLLWVKENEPEIFEKTNKFMFPKDYVRYRLTEAIGTDPTDAGNSLLLDSETKAWNWDLIQKLKLPEDIFPNLSPSMEVFGGVSEKVAWETKLEKGVPVITGAADMACSHIGTGAYLPNNIAITLSTSGQVVTSVNEINENKSGKVTYHLGAIDGTMYSMGTVFTGGLGVEWGYKFLHNQKEMKKEDYYRLDVLTEEMKHYSPGSEGLLFLPFLVGSSTPYFDPKDRAAWVGLTIGQKSSLLLHSILEGIAFNLLENIEVLGTPSEEGKSIYIGGGGSRNEVWVQMIADMTGTNVKKLASSDGSTIGTAIIGGVALSWFPSIGEAIDKVVQISEEVSFNTERYWEYQRFFEGYLSLYKAMNNYYHTFT